MAIQPYGRDGKGGGGDDHWIKYRKPSAKTAEPLYEDLNLLCDMLHEILSYKLVTPSSGQTYTMDDILYPGQNDDLYREETLKTVLELDRQLEIYRHDRFRHYNDISSLDAIYNCLEDLKDFRTRLGNFRKSYFGNPDKLSAEDELELFSYISKLARANLDICNKAEFARKELYSFGAKTHETSKNAEEIKDSTMPNAVYANLRKEIKEELLGKGTSSEGIETEVESELRKRGYAK